MTTQKLIFSPAVAIDDSGIGLNDSAEIDEKSMSMFAENSEQERWEGMEDGHHNQCYPKYDLGHECDDYACTREIGSDEDFGDEEYGLDDQDAVVNYDEFETSFQDDENPKSDSEVERDLPNEVPMFLNNLKSPAALAGPTKMPMRRAKKFIRVPKRSKFTMRRHPKPTVYRWASDDEGEHEDEHIDGMNSRNVESEEMQADSSHENKVDDVLNDHSEDNHDKGKQCEPIVLNFEACKAQKLHVQKKQSPQVPFWDIDEDASDGQGDLQEENRQIDLQRAIYPESDSGLGQDTVAFSDEAMSTSGENSMIIDLTMEFHSPGCEIIAGLPVPAYWDTGASVPPEYDSKAVQGQLKPEDVSDLIDLSGDLIDLTDDDDLSSPDFEIIPDLVELHYSASWELNRTDLSDVYGDFVNFKTAQPIEERRQDEFSCGSWLQEFAYHTNPEIDQSQLRPARTGKSDLEALLEAGTSKFSDQDDKNTEHVQSLPGQTHEAEELLSREKSRKADLLKQYANLQKVCEGLQRLNDEIAAETQAIQPDTPRIPARTRVPVRISKSAQNTAFTDDDRSSEPNWEQRWRSQNKALKKSLATAPRNPTSMEYLFFRNPKSTFHD